MKNPKRVSRPTKARAESVATSIHATPTDRIVRASLISEVQKMKLISKFLRKLQSFLAAEINNPSD